MRSSKKKYSPLINFNKIKYRITFALIVLIFDLKNINRSHVVTCVGFDCYVVASPFCRLSRGLDRPGNVKLPQERSRSVGATEPRGSPARNSHRNHKRSKCSRVAPHSSENPYRFSLSSSIFSRHKALFVWLSVPAVLSLKCNIVSPSPD
jgi:hypothetical protein